ncbi:MAG: tyrosine-type recombinase/integrase [Candidatus Polarisedimenticolaceae bacterium]|nr:tyrosine-type recombinase/integrase [Candidatus Polarisedimenticolaceae bacterium]
MDNKPGTMTLEYIEHHLLQERGLAWVTVIRHRAPLRKFLQEYCGVASFPMLTGADITRFGLLAVTGIRIREALALQREDADLDTWILTIHDTKFGKSRLLPLHPSTLKVLSDYARR